MLRQIVLTAAHAVALTVMLHSSVCAQAKDTVKVPGGLGFAEFRGYERWQLLSLSQGDKTVAAILGNDIMVAAYKRGIPANGQPFPDGARMAKIHWTPKKSATAPLPTMVPGEQQDVDFMVKDRKRFAATGGWGWAAFKYNSAAGTFRPFTTDDAPPQGKNASCGFTCHSIVQKRDYVFTEYAPR